MAHDCAIVRAVPEEGTAHSRANRSASVEILCEDRLVTAGLSHDVQPLIDEVL